MDIRTALEPLALLPLSIHDQEGQKEDIEDYIRSYIYSDRKTRRWRHQEQELVVDTLSKKADGM